MTNPIILFFLLGIIAGLVRSDTRIPSQIHDFVSTLLLLAIGLKGGMELSKLSLGDIYPLMIAAFTLGCLQTFGAYPILRKIGKFKRVDAASIAAHYGAVSIGTYAVCIAFLEENHIFFEEYMPLLVVTLEFPGIIVGLLLAKGISGNSRWGQVAHEVMTGKSVLLLLGGLIIGWISGTEGLAPIAPLFFDLFKGILAIFLLEMGIVAAKKIGALRQYGAFIIIFGIAMPVVSAFVTTFLGLVMGLSVGGTTALATLAASASYIAVPAAMNVSVPEANPTLSLTASLAVTFPFNIIIGVPLYYQMALWMT